MELTRPLSLAEKLVVVAVGLGVVHHIDHVLRQDHYGFPFKPQVTGYTFSLLVYVVFASVLLTRSRPWYRVWVMAAVVLGTTFAHSLIEPPQQIWGTWADNVSRPAPLFTPDGETNILNVESPLLAFVSVTVMLALQLVMIAALARFVIEARRARAPGQRPTVSADG